MGAIQEAMRLPVDKWTTQNLSAGITDLQERGGDCENIEVKAAEYGRPNIGPTLAAFANMPDGGILLLGLTDPGFEPVELHNIATLEAGIAAAAREALTPPASCRFATVEYRSKPILLCRVHPMPLADRPVRVGGVAYRRQSDGDYEMSDQEVAHVELFKTQALTRTHCDRQIVPNATTADFDSQIVSDFLDATRASSRRMATAGNDTILRWANVTTNEGAITTAGYYALAAYPQQHLPQLTSTAAEQLPANDPARTRNLTHIDGPLPEQLDAAMQWVQRNAGRTVKYDARGHGYDSYDIPMTAVREIIANALVHRSLAPVTDNTHINIRLRSDQLTVSQLGTPTGQSAVNPVLYEICKRLKTADGSRVIEGAGGGIREAYQALTAAGMREPRFIDASVRFTAILWAHGDIGVSHSSVNGTRAGRVLAVAQQPVSVAEIQAALGLSKAQARYTLDEMRNQGLIDVVGDSPRNTKYVAKEGPAPVRD